MKSLIEIKAIISRNPGRSAWTRGVNEYAHELLDNLPANSLGELVDVTLDALLNGAQNWQQYSEGGCSLIYNCDIAERLCSPSELARCKHGERNPNSREDWLQCQARALHQAAVLILRAARG